MSHWESYYFNGYEDYELKRTRAFPKTKTEKELDEKYGRGFYVSDPNQFPFENVDSEDDYGDDSWA